MATASKIYTNGLYQINGAFDEVTYNPNSGVITNTVAYSQNFTASGISTSGVYVSATTATVAPDGTYTAWKLTKAFSTVSSGAWLNVPSGVSGRYQAVFSLYVKPAEYSTFAFSYNTAGWVNFNLTLTQVTSINTGPILSAGSGGFVSGSITTASNGWYRVSATTINEAITPMQLAISSAGFIGNDVNGVYIWGIQAEVSSASSPSIYVPKVNNVIGSSPGVKTVAPGNVYISGLIDEVTYNPNSGVTKNLLSYSQDLTQLSVWSGPGNGVTPTVSSVLSPDNTTYATLYTITTSSNAARQLVAVNKNTNYTFSFYALKGSATNASYSVYDVTNSADIKSSTSYVSQINSTTWNRIVVPFTTPSNCVSASVYAERDNGSVGTLYIWGAQLELGSTATIYEATGISAVPSPTFASRADNQGNLYSPNYYDEITSQITWTFTVTSLYTSQTSGHKGIQSKFIGGLSDSNYYYDNSCWGSGLEPYPSITAIFPTTYYVSNVYLGPVENAGIPSGGGGWGTTWTRGSLQSSFDRLAWSTLTNLGQSYFSGGTDVTRVIPVNTTANYIRLVSNNTSSWWTPGVADFLAAAEFYFDATPASSYQNPTVTSGLALYLDAGYGYSYPGSGPTWYDLSGANNNMVLSNSPTYSSSNGGYFSLNGTSQSFTATSTTSYTISNGLTVGAWVNWSSFSTYGIILSHQSSLTTNDGWRFRTPGSNSLAFTLGAVADYYGCTASLNTNTWYYVAVSVSGNNGTATYYVNGQPAGSTAINTMQGTPTVFQVGSDFASQFYTGRISSVHMYPRALSVLEINQNFQALRSRYGI